MKRLLNAAFILAILFLSSCSGKLDRGNAEKIIKEFYQYPIIEDDSWRSNRPADQYKEVKDLGLVHQRYSDLYEITDKGKKYVTHVDGLGLGGGEDVLTNKLMFNEITGITFLNEAIAEVNYTVVRKSITAFGKWAGYKEGDIVNRSIQLKKFDDGWKIDREKYKNNIADYQALFADQKD